MKFLDAQCRLPPVGYGVDVESSTVIYLRNHEAAAQAGLDLFRRVTRSQRRADRAAELAAITVEIREDLESLQALMRGLHISPDLALTTLLRLGEKLGRWKPNGRLVRRSPLSGLLEIEALVDVVYAKLSGWRGLDAASAPQSPLDVTSLGILVQRAEAQLLRLHQMHHDIAAEVLSGTQEW